MGIVPRFPLRQRRGHPGLDEDVAVLVEDLHVAHGRIEALRAVDLHLPRGTSVAVIGPNGSGKSTLLSAISGLARPARGRVVLGDSATGTRRHAVAHVLQSTVANESVPITVVETVRMGCYGRRGVLGPLSAADRTAVEEAIARLRLEDLRHRQLHELSGGQRQRVYVAQGLAQRAPVLLLDEPITGLDLLTQDTITEVVDEERDRGRTVLLTTHDVGTARRCDLAVLLATGLVAVGEPRQALTPENLGRAYGGHVHTLPDGTIVLDEPHHHDHRHDDQLRT